MWLLAEIGVEHEIQVWPFDKSLRSPAFAALNPVGRVPALEIDGQVMIESGAMIEYVCEVFPDVELGRKVGHPERMAWLQWLHFAETISQHTAALTQQHIMLYEDHQRSPLIMKLEAKRLERCIALIERDFSGGGNGRECLLAGGFSAADIAVGQAVDMARRFVRLDPFAHVSGWLARITARPAYLASAPPDGKALYAQDFYAPWEAS